jgi:hypothetical protein
VPHRQRRPARLFLLLVEGLDLLEGGLVLLQLLGLELEPALVVGVDALVDVERENVLRLVVDDDLAVPVARLFVFVCGCRARGRFSQPSYWMMRYWPFWYAVESTPRFLSTASLSSLVMLDSSQAGGKCLSVLATSSQPGDIFRSSWASMKMTFATQDTSE